MQCCKPWADYLNIYIQKNENKTNNLKIFKKNVLLRMTLTYTTSNLNNLKNCLGSNQCIDCDSCNHKNRNPRHDLPQTYWE